MRLPWKTLCLTAAVVVVIASTVDAVMNGVGYEATAMVIGPGGQHGRPGKRNPPLEGVRWMGPANRAHRSGNPTVQRIRTGPAGPPVQVKRVYGPMKFGPQGNMPPPYMRQPQIYRFGPPPQSIPQRNGFVGKPPQYWKQKFMGPSPGSVNNFIPLPQRKRIPANKPYNPQQQYPTKFLSKPLSYKIEPQTPYGKPFSVGIGQQQQQQQQQQQHQHHYHQNQPQQEVITDSYGAPQKVYKVPTTTYGIPHPTQGSPEPPKKSTGFEQKGVSSSFVQVYQNAGTQEFETKTSYSFSNNHPVASSSSSLKYATNNRDLWNHSPVYKHNTTNSAPSQQSTTTSTTETPSSTSSSPSLSSYSSYNYGDRHRTTSSNDHSQTNNGFQPPKQTFGFTPYSHEQSSGSYYPTQQQQQSQQQDYLSPNYFD